MSAHNVQSNLSGSNIFGTMETCLRQGQFDPLRVNYGSRPGANGNNIVKPIRAIQ